MPASKMMQAYFIKQRLLSVEIIVIGDVVGSDVAVGGNDYEFAGGADIVNIIAVLFFGFMQGFG